MGLLLEVKLCKRVSSAGLQCLRMAMRMHEATA
jgi:hypothetical protein